MQIFVQVYRYNQIRNEKYLSEKTNEMYLAEIKASKDILTKELIRNSIPGEMLMSFFGVAVASKEQKNNDKLNVILRRLEVEYLLEMGDSPYGNIKRIVNFLKRFKRTFEEELRHIGEIQKELDEAKISLSLPNEHYDKLLKCKQELKEILRVTQKNKLVKM